LAMQTENISLGRFTAGGDGGVNNCADP